MKKLLLLCWTSLLMPLCSIADEDNSALLRAQQRDKLIIGVRNDVLLFGFKDPKTGEVSGFDIDLAKILTYYLLGDEQKLEFRTVTANNRFTMIQNAEVDLALANTSINEERKQLVDFSDSYFELGESILVTQDSKIRGLADLANQAVIVVKNTIAVRVLSKKTPSAKLIEYNNYVEAVRALREKKGVALVTGSTILLGIQKENPDLHTVGGLFTFESYGVVIQKGDELMQEAVNTALRKMRASGEYQALYQKWFGEIVEREYDKFYQKNFGSLLK